VIEKTMLAQVVITFGAAMCIESMIALAWTTDYRTVTPLYRVVSIDLSIVKLPLIYLTVLLIVFTTTLLLYFFLTRTGIGKFIRATADRPKVIQLMGVNPNKVRMLVVGLSIGLAGVAGSTISVVDVFTPSGIDYQIRAFVILVLAGFKNILNVILAGCALGIVESVSTLIVPPAISPIISYILFLSIAMWRRKMGYEI